MNTIPTPCRARGILVVSFLLVFEEILWNMQKLGKGWGLDVVMRCCEFKL